MSKKLSKLQLAQKKAEAAAKEVNKTIEELGHHTGALFTELCTIQSLFDSIRNVPTEDKLKYEKLKAIRVDWKRQVDKIEIEYKKSGAKAAGQGVAGIGAGVAVAFMGPSAAMGVATTFGVASTGTAISSLNGIAATNAALAWLGGGALSMGGGGIAAGNALLALAGPLGWTIAGVTIVASGIMLFKTKSDKERLENIFTHISNRDIKSFELAIVELNERIRRIVDESAKLNTATKKAKTFGTDYRQMSEAQQYELGAYVNLMESSTMLLVNPILGIQPKYTEQDYNKLCSSELPISMLYYKNHKELIISLANLLYKIELDDKDEKILSKSLRKNKEFLSSIKTSKKDFDLNDIAMVRLALKKRYEYK